MGEPKGAASTIDELPELKDISPFMASSRPFVLRSGVSDWPALTKWTGEEGKKYLISQHGSDMVDVAIHARGATRDGIYSGDVSKAESMSVSFQDFITGQVQHPDFGPYPAAVQDPGKCALMYLAQCSLQSSSPDDTPVLPNLREKAAYPSKIVWDNTVETRLSPCCPVMSTVARFTLSFAMHPQSSVRDVPKPHFIPGSLCSVNLWMRLQDCPAHSTLHYDGHHNVLCLIEGKKRVTLYRPDDQMLMKSLRPLNEPSCNHCGIEDRWAHHEKHPAQREAFRDLRSVAKNSSETRVHHRLRKKAVGDGNHDAIHPSFCTRSGCGALVELLPGDCLFIPEGWFHRVDSDAGTTAVNLWWPGLGSYLAASPLNASVGCCKQVHAAWMFHLETLDRSLFSIA